MNDFPAGIKSRTILQITRSVYEAAGGVLARRHGMAKTVKAAGKFGSYHLSKLRTAASKFFCCFLTLLLFSSAGISLLAIPVSAASSDTQPFLADGTINNSYWGIKTNNSGSAAANVAALNKALAWASQNGLRDIKLSAGTYYVDGSHTRVYSVSDKSISIPSDINFDLNDSTLIQIPNDKEGYAIFTVVGSENVRLFDGKLVGDRPNHNYVNSSSKTHEYGFGIDIRGSSQVELTGLDIYDMTGDSVLVGGKDTYLSKGGTISKDITISDCKFHDNRRQGVSVIGASGVEITDCEIYNIGMVKGTAPMCGIDLENELDWPVEYVTISDNSFYNNKNAAVMVHRGSSDALIENNTISGYLALVYGEKTTVSGNTVKNGGIYSVDTSEPIYTMIRDNQLYNSDIQVQKNFATVISGNTISGGVIKFNYASGAIYGNTITNTQKKAFAIQVYADKKAVGYSFTVYLSNNKISGKYTSQYSVSSYSKLSVITDTAKAQEYIGSFGTSSMAAQAVPSGQEEMELQSSTPEILLGVFLLAALSGLGITAAVGRRKKSGDQTLHKP